MNPKIYQDIEFCLQKIIHRYYLDKSICIFDEFIKYCQDYYDGPAHSLVEIRAKQNTKLKGDLFEHFAILYFRHCSKIPLRQIWLLKDVPEQILQKLSLKRNDFGIDCIAETETGGYCAIQVKYRKKRFKMSHGIPWQQLSTFYGLINRTGPYVKCIVFTNANWVRHMGKKTSQDLSICYGTLSNISLDNWIKMANFQGCTLSDDKTESKQPESTLNDLRLHFFNKKV